MGICGSAQLSPEERNRLKEEAKRNRNFEQQIRNGRDRDQALNKLLLLGAGESGKSTLFKQMVMIYGNQKTIEEDERKRYVEVIFNNVSINTKSLAHATAKFTEPSTQEAKDAKEKLLGELKEEAPVITQDIAETIRQFWNDPGVQATYQMRNQFQLNDSAKYFFDKIMDICQLNWIPSTDDILRTRVRTTGIVEHNFTIDENKFRMFDVGGQRNERKKWIHCFENVTAVLFVAAISEFDQVLYEDEKTNRVTEALHLFDEISNSQWFTNTSIILFLNKSDLYREKIAAGKLITDSTCPELQQFTGDCSSFEETTQYISAVFCEKNPEKEILFHVTCATDTDNVEFVFNAVKEIIISRSLVDCGLA